MKLQFWLGLTLAVGPMGTATAFEQSGNWTRSSLQGTTEIYLHGPNNSRIELYCSPEDPAAEDSVLEGGIVFTFKDASPPANMLLVLTVDGQKFQFRTPGNPSETSLPCPECSSVADFWRAVRVSKTVEMRLADGRRVRFASAGAEKFLSKEVCKW